MSHVHPSRRGNFSYAAEPARAEPPPRAEPPRAEPPRARQHPQHQPHQRLPQQQQQQPPPPQRGVWLHLVADPYRGVFVRSQHEFNRLRVQLLLAAAASLPRPSRLGRLMSVDWIDHDTGFIKWHLVTPVHDPLVITDLVSASLIGVYWLVNHADEAGLLSIGQVVDLLASLDYLVNRNILQSHWPESIIEQTRDVATAALDAATPLAFTLCEAPPVRRQQPGGGIGDALAMLAPLVAAAKRAEAPYDPAAAV